ncbi:MAG: hypothetical protein CMD06_00410 [Flavobacteriales bacterium]|nr:hypothetical protein [Flavobacteriales bacterium]MBC91823.1 hypothetical protein [Flavobacteriaceae bacterium]
MKKIFTLMTLVVLVLSSCQMSPEADAKMSGGQEDQATFEKQIETHTTFAKAFNEENMEMLMSTVADTLKWSPAFYNENKILGVEDFKSQIQVYFDQFDEVTFHPGEGLINEDAPAYWAGSHYSSGEGMVTSSPNGMRVYGTWSAIHTETGAKIYNKYYGVLNFNSDNKVAEISDWMDISGMQAQIENHVANN